MLKSVTLENYTTFIKKTKIDFEATNSKILEETNVGDYKILKGSLFCGENASGKTNALKGIRLLLFLLFKDSEIPFIKLKSMYDEKDKYSFEYEFCIDGETIIYKIVLSTVGIIQEKLTINNQEVLTRTKNKGTYFQEKQEYDNLNQNVLLLRSIYFNTRFSNNILLNHWFDFMSKSLYIDSYNRHINVFNVDNQDRFVMSKYVEENGIEAINQFLRETGYNSTAQYVNSIENNHTLIKTENEGKDIFVRKNGTEVDIPLAAESLGNQVLFNLILPVLYACQNDCMLLIDEFSSGLHNDLEESLLRYFFTHSKNSQIFFVSHSTNVMKTTILRPDQIYSFKFDSGTIIKRFSDESPREGQNLEKMYLSGVFDGLPNYNKYL